MMRSFLALYRGPSIESSELIAVSADQKLIKNFVKGLVEEEPDYHPWHNGTNKAPPDPRG